MQSPDFGDRKGPASNEQGEQLDETAAPPIDQELILRCVRLEASADEQQELRRLTETHQSWKDALDATYRAEDERAERAGLSEEDKRFQEEVSEVDRLPDGERAAAAREFLRKKVFGTRPPEDGPA
jgi:hypothetical protein